MAKLTPEQKELFEELQTQSQKALRAGKDAESLRLSLQAWEMLPEPRGAYDESFHLVETLIFICMKLNDLENAKKWSETLYACCPGRADSGECEFISGIIAFEQQDELSAFNYFQLANKKSAGKSLSRKEKKTNYSPAENAWLE